MPLRCLSSYLSFTPFYLETTTWADQYRKGRIPWGDLYLWCHLVLGLDPTGFGTMVYVHILYTIYIVFFQINALIKLLRSILHSYFRGLRVSVRLAIDDWIKNYYVFSPSNSLTFIPDILRKVFRRIFNGKVKGDGSFKINWKISTSKVWLETVTSWLPLNFSEQQKLFLIHSKNVVTTLLYYKGPLPPN